MKNKAVIIALSQQEACSLNLTIEYLELPVGRILIASSEKGICSITLAHPFQSDDEALKKIGLRFPNAVIKHGATPFSEAFKKCWEQQPATLQFHLKGTPFQIRVWEKLLEIPAGKTTTYGELAKAIEHPRAYRAVGSAVGDNPVFYAIPCHRVLPASGKTGQYFWGSALKATLLKKEQSE